jgi:hypothetical protein
MGKYKYTQDEKNKNKVLKMNEMLSESISDQNKKVKRKAESSIESSEALLKDLGYDLDEIIKPSGSEQLERLVILSTLKDWEVLVEEANEMIPYEVELEDILSSHEFAFALDDLERIKDEFASKVKMNRTDIIFLFIATALQTIKWVLLPELGEKIDSNTRIDDKAGDAKVKEKKDVFADKHKDWDTSKDSKGSRLREKEGKSWKEILYKGVPYDVTAGSPAIGINMEGKNHRYKTLGHDPILGWVFGTANILTDTLTLNNLTSYRIKNGKFTDETVFIIQVFGEAHYWIKDDFHRLPAALFRQALHYESDKYTKLGLPVPFLGAFSESLAGNLYKNQYDALCFARDTKIVSGSAGISIIINMIIGLLHGLFYDPEVDGDREFYEARTRKVLIYSNVIATSSNIAVSCITENPKQLDIGGLLVTVSRLFSDIRFITKLKKEFITGQLEEGMQKELDEADRLYTEYII